MVVLDPDIVEQWWKFTKSSNWDALRSGLDEAFSQELIEKPVYDQILWAINKLESKGTDFPTNSQELILRLNYYI